MVGIGDIAKWRVLAGLIALLGTVLLHSAQAPTRLAEGPAASSYSHDHKTIRPQLADIVAFAERESCGPGDGNVFVVAGACGSFDGGRRIRIERADTAAADRHDIKPWRARAPPALTI